jgi:hypothetical protein
MHRERLRIVLSDHERRHSFKRMTRIAENLPLTPALPAYYQQV